MPANTAVFSNQRNFSRELSGLCQQNYQVKTAISEMNQEWISRDCFEFDFEVAHFFQQPDE
jgi:hypothetical protein